MKMKNRVKEKKKRIFMIRGSYCLFPIVGVGILQCLFNFSYHVIW